MVYLEEDSKFDFNEEKQFALYQKLMLLSLEEPNIIFDICCKVLISMCKLNNDSEEDFEKVLTMLRLSYKELGSTEDMILRAIKEMLGI